MAVVFEETDDDNVCTEEESEAMELFVEFKVVDKSDPAKTMAAAESDGT